MHDVFLCYVWEARPTAVLLQRALEERGLAVFRDETGMRDHDHIETRIDAALRASRTLVALTTPPFLTSEYCRQELHFALSRAHRLGPGRARVLSVLSEVPPADVRPQPLKAWRLPAPDQEIGTTADGIAAHVAALRAEDDRLLGDAPDLPAPRWFPRPPPPGPQLCGRELELWDLHEALRAESSVVTLTGLPGQGKTTLARAFARQFGGDYAEIHFHGARDPQWTPPGAEPYLWIVDDVRPGMEVLAPTPGGRTLLIGDAELGEFVRAQHDFRLGPLDPLAALTLLTSRWPAGARTGGEHRLDLLRADRREYAAAVGITAALGRYPLALAVAAGLAGRAEFSSFTELAETLRNRDEVALAVREDVRRRIGTDHAGDIATTLLTAIDALPEPGRDLIRLASLAGAAPLPRSLVTAVVPGADEAIGSVTASNLADDTGCGWLVPPLVSRALRFTDTDRARRHALREAAITAAAAELLAGRDPDKSFVDSVGLLPHVDALAESLRDPGEWHLCNEAARVQAELGDSLALLETSTRLYDACREVLGEDHETTVAALVALGVGHGLHGDHEKALRLKQEAHALLEARLGAEHPDTLTALNNLAITHLDQGDAETASALTARVYRARRRKARFSGDTVEALMNHAIAVGRSGRFGLSARLRRLAYAYSLRVHGEDHPRTFDALNTMAIGELDLGRVELARVLFEQVCQGRRRVLGRTADTASALANLATVRDDPEDLLREAYFIRVEAQGPDHFATEEALRSALGSTTATLSEALAEPVDRPPGSLGEIRLDDDRVDERIELFERALAWQEEVTRRYGHEHPAALTATAQLAHALGLLDQFDEQTEWAWEMINTSADGLRDTLGAHAPATIAAERVRTWLAKR
ncbi:Tetratricopeptide repeat-containing protein [Amycolatopsis sacchari]|uniref:Tetratricopeptide repeat-containing protein n=1 Tax=Amycolatopsis sacchari TaxID=115433 RepID=A0A1I3VRT6_9PSEU|nr:tetratricopeptide repeat protein [Amycolatopsis sacchari]SFJ97882.1 Tetratricopeptide repeat-containing protein [Amycolatopsis sacchari]